MIFKNGLLICSIFLFFVIISSGISYINSLLVELNGLTDEISDPPDTSPLSTNGSAESSAKTKLELKITTKSNNTAINKLFFSILSH